MKIFEYRFIFIVCCMQRLLKTTWMYLIRREVGHLKLFLRKCLSEVWGLKKL